MQHSRAFPPADKEPHPLPDRRFVALDGENLRRLRERHFGSRDEFAHRSGIAVGTLARAEVGGPVRRTNARLIAQALKVDLQALLHDPQHQVPPADEGIPGWDRFSELIEEKTRDFIGREYILSALDNFVGQNKNGYCILEGDPGMGKTSILAQWIQRQPGGCVAFFNVRALGLNRAHHFLESVCSQLVHRYGLRYQPLPPDATQDGVFLYRLLNESVASANKKTSVIVAVDALDEVDLTGQSPGVNVLYLPPLLPDGVFFIVTRRRKSELPFVSQTPQQIINLLDFADESRTDIRGCLQASLTRPRLRRWIEQSGTTEHRFVDILTEKSDNNFMYLHYVLPALEAGTCRDLTIDTLPAGLEGYYSHHWQLMGMVDRPLKRSKINIVYILSEVRQPVPRRLIAEFSGVDELTVQETLNEWEQFLHQDIVSEQGAAVKLYSVYHASFRDFLHRQDIVSAAQVTLPQINALIADNLWRHLFGPQRG